MSGSPNCSEGHQNGKKKTVAESKYLRLVNYQGWDFVERRGSTGVVTVLPLTNDDRVVFVEQHRIPVDAIVIEFPAGLSGDDLDSPDESGEQAARRELVEETGFDAKRIEHLMTGPSSAGLTDELISFYIATELERVGPGGGVDSESIVIHEVPLADVDSWLKKQIQKGKLLDARLLTGLYLIQQYRQTRDLA